MPKAKPKKKPTLASLQAQVDKLRSQFEQLYSDVIAKQDAAKLTTGLGRGGQPGGGGYG